MPFVRDLGLDPDAPAAILDAAARAIALEQRFGTRPIPLSVRDVAEVPDSEHQIWKLTVWTDAPMEDGGSWVGATLRRDLSDVDDTLTPPWQAEVVEVDADDDAVYVAGKQPPPGIGACRLSPFDFLRAPHDALKRPDLAALRAAMGPLLQAAAGRITGRALPATTTVLPSWNHAWSYVWGPPGTGKTYTLVHEVAKLLDDPSERVLVVSNTNRAVDEVALRLGAHLLSSGPHLLGLRRLGRVHTPRAYTEAGLSTVLPKASRDLMRALSIATNRWQQTRERAARAEAYKEIQVLQAELPTLTKRALDDQDRCIVTTLHAALRAVVSKDVVDVLSAADAPFTTLVIDEAGLVGRVQIATIALLAARRVVLVGDPRQLSPIAKAARSMPPEVVTWVARSALDHLRVAEQPHVHRLVVQRRMHPEIRQVVSALSYDGELQDGPEVSARPWPGSGTLSRLPRAVWYVLDAHDPHKRAAVASRRGPGGRSRIRPMALDVLDALLTAQPELRDQQVRFVSPYRAQCTLVNTWIDAHQLPRWHASTIHAQQGSEADVVIFDTVHASSTGWPAQEWVRLVNVGMSRARHMLLVLTARAEMNQAWMRPLRRHLVQRVLAPVGDARAWRTLGDDSAIDMFAPAPSAEPVVAEPVVAEPFVAPTTAATSLGAQIAQRRAMRPVLSHEQARLIHRELSDAGPRLVRGVAGSGKTLVLAHWAVRALRGLHIGSLAIVYANQALRPLMEQMLVRAWEDEGAGGSSIPWGRITLVHIRDLLRDMLTEHGLPEAGQADDRDPWDYENQAVRIHEAATPIPRFDAVFLDEAQDLGHAPIGLITDLVRPQPDGRRPVMVFYDNAQNIYGRGTPQWSTLGLDFRGRSDVMRESFRATRQSTELALNVLDHLTPLDQDPDLRELMRPASDGVRPLLERAPMKPTHWWRAHFCATEGELPVVRVFDSRDAELDHIVQRVRRWLHDGVQAGDIRVLANSKEVREPLVARLRAALAGLTQVVTRTAEGFVACDDLVVTTAHSFKGYDAELVIVAGADRFTARGDVLTAPLYVAMTRAQTQLVVTATHSSATASQRVVTSLLRAAQGSDLAAQRF